jgi:multiple sugar transport system ATP-binding protein
MLRLIAGVLQPDEGDIRFEGESMVRVPAGERRVRMVFQDYALYPHLRVYKERGYSNLGFPLNLRGVKGKSLSSTIERLVARLGIQRRLFGRRPRELSAGEKQKVAFGRALALPPRVLLLDEPFSNLDGPNRVRAREELAQRLHEEPVTTIYVTHNLREAFRLAGRVAVMREGRIVQVATPDALRAAPADDLVRELVESALD